MPSYKLEFTGQAEKALARIARSEPAIYRRVSQALDDLGRDPYQGKPLKGELRGHYSYRVGSYRIVYVIQRDRLLVIVIDIGHRRDIYR
ncbi:MAG: type II toxin-antitoxin system RelE/ParE family toxin [Candidatus Omnitrophica bacterium]|nr:type II toxin-antitoxin system RelE/ParE family toxin [Candidatus Omnitrophota bacterium]